MHTRGHQKLFCDFGFTYKGNTCREHLFNIACKTKPFTTVHSLFENYSSHKDDKCTQYFSNISPLLLKNDILMMHHEEYNSDVFNMHMPSISVTPLLNPLACDTMSVMRVLNPDLCETTSKAPLLNPDTFGTTSVTSFYPDQWWVEILKIFPEDRKSRLLEDRKNRKTKISNYDLSCPLDPNMHYSSNKYFCMTRNVIGDQHLDLLLFM